MRALAVATEIGDLTALQRRVIEEYLLPRDPQRILLYRTTARIELPPAEAVQLVAATRADLAGTSGRTHPLRPLTMVLNKFKAELAAAIERGVA